ncbi:hypothetical protein HDU96_008581 [Phlyctochytrium bullatum]|nr:hypothetical protein HDU96_008581 [Phlyctochytrium bullatum]
MSTNWASEDTDDVAVVAADTLDAATEAATETAQPPPPPTATDAPPPQLTVATRPDASLIATGTTTASPTSTTAPEEEGGRGTRETTSSVLRGLSFLVSTAKAVTDVSFAAAKLSTSLSLHLARTAITTVGDRAGVPTAPVTLALSAAEHITLASLSLGQFWTDFGLHTAAGSLRTLDHVVGDTETARAIEAFARLVQAEVARSVDGASVADVGFVETLRCVMALVVLQRLTADTWRARAVEACGPAVLTVDVDVAAAAAEDDRAGTAWSPTDETPRIVELDDGEGPELDLNAIDFAAGVAPASSPDAIELAIGEVGTPPDTDTDTDAMVLAADAAADPATPDWPRRWREIRRYVRFATGAYGRHIARFLQGDNPVPAMVNPRADPDRAPPPDPVHPNRRFYARHTDTRLPDVVHSSYHPAARTSWLDDLVATLSPSPSPAPPVVENSNEPPAPRESVFVRPTTLKYHPTFFLVLDHPNRAIVVALRGTLSFHDVMVDLTCAYVDVRVAGATHRVHAGMYAAAARVALPGAGGPRVFEAVRECVRRYPGYGVVVTGHSLGAGVASLVALFWADPVTGRVSPSSGLVGDVACGGGVETPNPGLEGCVFSRGEGWRRDVAPPAATMPRFHCYAFASPAVMDNELSAKYAPVVTSLAHGGDFVPRLSLGGVRDVAGMVVWLHRRPRVVAGLVGRAVGAGGGEGDGEAEREAGGDEDPARERVGDPVALRRRMEAACVVNERLVPAGTVIWSVPVEGGVGRTAAAGGQEEERRTYAVRTVREPLRAFEEVELGLGMLLDHMPNVYEEVWRAAH